jgi:succinyldiaminopimelate transaminase
VSLRPEHLPDFPWDALAPFHGRAATHPDGPVILAAGTPVDPTPGFIREALSLAADSPGYPATSGSLELREAIVEWFARRRGVTGLTVEAVLPTIGSKEFVAWLPALLGIGEGDAVVIPRLAYPTYEVGVTLAGATALATNDVESWSRRGDVKLVWVNSPSNPTGAILERTELSQIVSAARGIGAIVASDECYAEFPWIEPWLTGGVPSILDPAVGEGSHEGLLAASSLSKRSNCAGYRAAFVAGDVGLISRMLEVRRHVGMMMPGPVQTAAIAALGDDAHVENQREVYGRRRAILAPALEAAGFTIEHSEAGLYLWATRGEGCWETVAWLAEKGIIVAPGDFYGAAGERHVRVALTATDERIASAANRLSGRR